MRTSILLGRPIAAAVRGTREAYGWTQAELGHKSGTSQSSISRIEAELLESVQFGIIGNVLDALDIRTSIELQPPFAAAGRQRDRVHAWCLGYCARRLAALGWTVEFEVEVGLRRPLGWIDILAFHTRAGSLFVGEVKTDLPDVGATERQVRLYTREAPYAARRLGWQFDRIGIALIGLATQAFDRRVSLNRDLLRRSLPGRTAELAQWLRDPVATPPPPTLALIDPSSRRSHWLQAPTVDRRRTTLPYVDYADAARVAGLRPRR